MMLKMLLPLLRVAIVAMGVLLISTVARGEGRQESGGKDIPEGFQLLPRVGISTEYGGFIVNQENYTSMLRRRLEVDVLQYRRHIFYIDFDEKTFFGIPGNGWEFNLMKYDVNLAGYRYDFGDFYLGLFIHHQCNNPIHTKDYHTLIDRERANIYMAGLEFLTKNMRIGMKDRGINFDSPDDYEFLGRFAGGLWLSKVFTRENINLNWDLKAQLRYDILRYWRLVPYVEIGGELLVGNITRLAPAAEVGVRYHINKVDFTPFFRWSRDQEALSIDPSTPAYIAKNTLYAGARLEVLLDSETFGPSANGQGLQLFPEIHGNANYALFLNNPNFTGHGSMELDFEALRWKHWTIFLYTDMNFNSRKEDFKPDKVNYWMDYGLTYAWDRYFVEGYVKNHRRVDDNIFRGTTERSNQAGLRAGTKGMKPGHYNDGISFKGPDTFQWLNNWNAQASVGHYFNNRDWQYLWNLAAKVRWDMLRWYFVIPYIQGDVNWLAGGGSTGDATEYAVEPGLRFHGVLDLAVYYRFQHQQNVLLFKGPSENQNMVGVRVLF
jgi:hypothetical protein